MEYIQASLHETNTNYGSVGVQILVSVDRSLSRDEQLHIRRATDEIIKVLLTTSVSLSPGHKLERDTERSRILGLFPTPIFVEEIPNGYCHDWCCSGKPWFIVTTAIGRIKIGWRKRVILIDWEGSLEKRSASQLFPGEDVTKDGCMIHAWGYEKAREYINVLLATEPHDPTYKAPR